MRAPRPARPAAPSRDPGDGGVEPPPRYTLYRAGPRLGRRQPEDTALEGLAGLGDGGGRGGGGRRGPRRPGAGGRVVRLGRFQLWPLTWRRALVGLLGLAVFWLLLSVVVFLLSATFEEQGPTGPLRGTLDSAGYPLWSANNILVLGSDSRPVGSHEPGATTGSAPSRSDVIMLIRTGAGHSARLSIPRDTIVNIPGHGEQKINAAYAFGGPSLAVSVIKSYLGIPINHLVEMNFANFPQLIDAMGGVDVTVRSCVVSYVDGGFSRGGYTLRLRPGSHHLDGKAALALARTRHNACHPNESDLTRAMRQQQLFTAMKSRLFSFGGFLRLPFVSWRAPEAIRSDMGGPTLLAVFSALAAGGTPPTRLLEPTGVQTLPDGSVGLVVSDAAKRAAVARFMAG